MGRDALPCDDVRYFTVDVRPPSKVLLLGRNGGRHAVSPRSARADGGRRRGAIEVRVRSRASTMRLDNMQLADYAAVFLVNPPPLPNAAWQSLVDFAEAGGGVGISWAATRGARR